MLKRNTIAAVMGVLVLSACATSQQSCMEQATRDLRTIDLLIAETEANISRGYGIERVATQSSGVNFCAGGFGSSVGVSFCSGGGVSERERVVPIDVEAEQRKLNELQSRREEVAAESSRAVAACNAV